MSYLLVVISLVVFGGIALLVHFLSPNKQNLIVGKILTGLLIVVFIVRFMCFKDVQIFGDTSKFIDLATVLNPLINPAIGIISNFLIWFEITAFLLVAMRPFYHFRTMKYLVKFVALPIFVLCGCFMEPILFMSQGFGFYNEVGKVTLLSILYPIEIGLGLALSIYYWFKNAYARDLKEKDPTLLALGSNLSVKSRFLPRNYDLKNLNCTSSNESIISFEEKNDGDMKIKANKKGKAYINIVANDGEINKRILINVFERELVEEMKYNKYDSLRKVTKKDIMTIIISFLLINIATLPPYFMRSVFGEVSSLIHILDINFTHRLVLYATVLIFPFGMYFGLRNKHKDVIHFALNIVSLGTLIGFMAFYKYDSLLEPWAWPFHLCNTAMFLMPICLIFKPKRLFYFTYFINVLGALIAMLMPNYSHVLNAMDPRIFQFWYNHAIAFGMPLLCVALKQFQRPKLKQFYYSMAWFFGYFVIALFMNVLFSAMGHKVDYFFINSDFVADKLGDWAENLFNITASFKLGKYTLTFHPPYQLVFFFVYVLLGVAVWFVYELGFNIADSHYELMTKLKAIKVDQLALKSALNGRSLDEPMDKDAGVKFELKHFSKKYASSKVYAVRDANLEVYGGEIFGFLGPNGAGKSTIIKSTVGIQPITEGNIEICGFDCAKQPVQAKSLIGFVPDHYALYEKLTGREYLNYIADIYEVSKEDRDERLNKYIKLFQLESSIDNKIKTYSHGMKQKITIMAALVHNPKVWILDEPLTGLDPTSIFQVKECMKQHAAEGNIVFFSSHIIDIVEKLCQRIAIIKKGKILCVKTVEEIEQSGKSLEEFYLETIGEKLEEK